jgi:short-subunit dehydrogenase
MSIPALRLLQLAHGYNIWRSYAQSKLAMILCSYELARRLEGSGITVNSLHPGFVASNLGMNNFGPHIQRIFNVLPRFGASPEQGAKTTIYLATSPDIQQTTGQYFAKCHMIKSSSRSYDRALQQRMWEESLHLIKLPPDVSIPSCDK